MVDLVQNAFDLDEMILDEIESPIFISNSFYPYSLNEESEVCLLMR